MSFMPLYYRTIKAVLIPTVTGTISFFSSALILSIIWRSHVNSSYHRIMAFFSFWDMVLSFAVAITTLPMPSDVGDTYDFAGPSYGNVTTCEAQAFAVLLGIGLTICSNSVLSLYYLRVCRFCLYTHLRAHETGRNLVCRLLLGKKKIYSIY